MNPLSWLIYIASIVGPLKAVTLIGAFISLIIGLICLVPSKATWTRYSSQSDDEWAQHMAFKSYLGRLSRVALTISSIALFVGLFVPTKAAVYMIAASEVGEMVVNSPDAQEMMDDLKRIIKKNLKEHLGAPELAKRG